MKQTIKTNTFATSSTSFTDVTGLSVTITPQSSSNKVLVLTSLHIGSGASGRDNKYRIVRGSTNIGSDFFCRRETSNNAITYCDYFLDSPNSTSTQTYKVQILCENNEVFINRNGSNQDYGQSTILVMEVGM